MPEALVASRKPFLVELKAGRRYTWCACGRSKRQPFCDGSHAGTGFEPVSFIADADREALLCGCKKSGRAPFCDGTHNSLADTYERASAGEIAASGGIPITPRSRGRLGKSELDGGCFVATVDYGELPARGTARLGPVISRLDGARFLSQWCMLAQPGGSPVFTFPGSDAVLFLPAGAVSVTISGREFAVGRECGIYVHRGEAFRIDNPLEQPLRLLLTVCPGRETVETLDEMPDRFESAIPERVHAMDPSRREPMANRFYQVLNGAETGCPEVTQFIGEVPRSRAAAHRHLYEEVIVILEGEGFMWTESARAAVAPGDVIFLPRKQLHSLECTTDTGMRLMGAFYPAGSPAVNY